MSAGELAELVAVADASFGLRHDDAEVRRRVAGIEAGRALAAFDGGELVGTASALSLELTLPGLELSRAAGVADVGVLPTHRRKGLMAAMIRRQVDDIHDRAEPVALLTASEGSIYGRFGFGPATFCCTYRISCQGAAQRDAPPAGAVSILDASAAAEALPPVFDEARRRQPGEVSRPVAWWGELLADNERRPDGSSALFRVVHVSPGEVVDGYALYWLEGATGQGMPAVVKVREICAPSAGAYARLWAYLCEIDLTESVEAVGRPTDEALRWMLADTRQLRAVSCSDHIWARLVDVGEALRARRYAIPGSVALEVRDDFCPWNSTVWRLSGGPEGAEVRSERAGAPDLSLDVSDLSSAYLGATTFSSLARGKRVVEHSCGALRQADGLFASEPPPFCSSTF